MCHNFACTKFTSLIDKGGTQNPQSERQCPQDKPLAAYHADDILQPLQDHNQKWQSAEIT